MARNLNIPWDENIPSSYDQFSDVKRVLGGAQAKTSPSVPPERLVDAKRTLLGSLGKAPSSGETTIPDDRKRFLNK